MGKIERIQVSPEDRERLERLVKDRNAPQKIVWRSRIMLLAGDGIGASRWRREWGKSVLTVRRWRRRYAAKGVDGLLKDATRPPGRKPHLTKTFKLSCDRNFVAKVEDIVGLYLNPPDKALVQALDEKSQIPALDRTQPGLPMKKGLRDDDA